MELTNFNDKHYIELSQFWGQYGWVAPSIDVLPRKGFVALQNGKIVAAAFVYMSCSGMALLDWVIGDKQAHPLIRGKAVYKVINACQDYAKEQGKSVLYTVTANKALQETYRKIGFQDMESNATSMAMSLDGTKLDFIKE